jgi:hypothetical protein
MCSCLASSHVMLSHSENHVVVDVDSETAVLLHASTAIYYELNHVARRIWELAEPPISIDALCDSLAREYKIDRKRCASDLQPFLAQLEDAGILACGAS